MLYLYHVHNLQYHLHIFGCQSQDKQYMVPIIVEDLWKVSGQLVDVFVLSLF